MYYINGSLQHSPITSLFNPFPIKPEEIKDIGFVSTASAPSFLHKICLERLVTMVRICIRMCFISMTLQVMDLFVAAGKGKTLAMDSN